MLVLIENGIAIILEKEGKKEKGWLWAGGREREERTGRDGKNWVQVTLKKIIWFCSKGWALSGFPVSLRYPDSYSVRYRQRENRHISRWRTELYKFMLMTFFLNKDTICGNTLYERWIKTTLGYIYKMK